MARARAKQLPLTKAMDAEARKQNKLVGNKKDRGQAELVALRESLKSQARHVAKRQGAKSHIWKSSSLLPLCGITIRTHAWKRGGTRTP